MKSKISGTISGVSVVKSGTQEDGTPWKWYEVVFKSGDKEIKTRTFDDKFAKNVGENGTWWCEEEERTSKTTGRKYTARKINSYEDDQAEDDQAEEEVQTESNQVNIAKGIGTLRGDISRLGKGVKEQNKEILQILRNISKKLDITLTRKTEKGEIDTSGSKEKSDYSSPPDEYFEKL